MNSSALNRPQNGLGAIKTIEWKAQSDIKLCVSFSFKWAPGAAALSRFLIDPAYSLSHFLASLSLTFSALGHMTSSNVILPLHNIRARTEHKEREIALTVSGRTRSSFALIVLRLALRKPGGSLMKTGKKGTTANATNLRSSYGQYLPHGAIQQP